MFAVGAEQSWERLLGIWDLLAYAGRYGHQSMESFMNRPLIHLTRFTDALGRRLSKEDELTQHTET